MNFRYFLELKWASYFVAFWFFWTLLEKYLGWHDIDIARYHELGPLYVVVSAIIFYFALLDVRNVNFGRSMSYSNAFQTGMVMTLIILLVMPINQFLLLTLVSPDLLSNLQTYSVELLGMTVEKASSEYSIRYMIIQSEVRTLLLGTSLSLTLGVIIRKSR